MCQCFGTLSDNFLMLKFPYNLMNAVLLEIKLPVLKKLITKVKGHYLMSENDPLVLIPRKCPVVTVKCGPCNRQIT